MGSSVRSVWNTGLLGEKQRGKLWEKRCPILSLPPAVVHLMRKGVGWASPIRMFFAGQLENYESIAPGHSELPT